MTSLSAGALKRITKTFLVSNTPDYLYEELRGESAVQELSERESAEELIQTITGIDQQDDRDLSDIAEAYAATVALTFKPGSKVLPLLDELTLESLKWVEPILQRWEDDRRPVTSFSEQAQATLRQPEQETSGSTSSREIQVPPVVSSS